MLVGAYFCCDRAEWQNDPDGRYYQGPCGPAARFTEYTPSTGSTGGRRNAPAASPSTLPTSNTRRQHGTTRTSTCPAHADHVTHGVGAKRALATREFPLGIDGLERFFGHEPLRRVHECLFGVLALESEPVDPRL
jgi:hypothetical protein